MTDVMVPQLGEGIASCQITFWFSRPPDRVEQGKDLVELATDKAAFNLPCPVTGVLAEVFFQEGDTVRPGERLAVIREDA